MRLIDVIGQRALAPLIIVNCTDGSPVAGTVEFRQEYDSSMFVMTLRIRDERFLNAELGQFLLTYQPTEPAVPEDESHIVRSVN